jgi:stage V sporulation protein G
MNITEVRIKLVKDDSQRLMGFCSITIENEFVIRDLKIIEGNKGLFVAMPSRKLNDRCSRCGNKNCLRSCFCQKCGLKLDEHRAPKDSNGKAKLYADIAHPINAKCREEIQQVVIDAYMAELTLSKQPGYTCRYEEYDVGEDFE